MTEGADARAWRILNIQRVEEVLKGELPATRSKVFESIALLLADPTETSQISTLPLRGRAARTYPDRRLAKLPDNWILTYSVHPNGVPPLGGRLVVVHALIRIV